MTLIICVDDRLGMTFNKRRQSRDAAVCRDIADMAAGKSLCMQERSSKLFDGLGANLIVQEELAPKEGCICFDEFVPPAQLARDADKLVIYRWNRHYPADMYCDIPMEGWRQTEVKEFPGTSHEKITKEVYVRE